MKKKLEKIIKMIKKINISYILKTTYIKYYRNLPIIDNYILLDSQHGKNINGNIYYILKELNDNQKYDNYELFLMVDKSCYQKQLEFLNNKNIKKVKLIKYGTKKHYKLLACSKYLINDTSFLNFYIKKEGQVYLNVWHGTPLKYLGKSMNNGYHAIGNVQRNFIFSDYLLYPNEYTMNHMIEDYMLSNISDAKIVLSGYPRNSVFFDNKSKEKIRKELKIEEKNVIAYMPTYRDDKSINEEVEINTKILTELDKKMTDNEIMYVNLHPFVKNSINYNFKHIKKFPENYETYEFLNCTDCLVTDYSSVFFDYANKDNKIILFAYDEEEYFKNRGCYISLDELPFVKVKDINELYNEMKTQSKCNYTAFKKKYCQFDSAKVTQQLCELLIFGNNKNITLKEMPKNNKKNVLIYAGALAKNGITTSLSNLLNNIDLKAYNYYLTFPTHSVSGNKSFLKEMPTNVNYIPTDNLLNCSILEKMYILMWYSGIIKKLNTKFAERIYKENLKRLYGNIKFAAFINFSGYNMRRIMLYSFMDSYKSIYVHSNMNMEIKERKNQKKHILNFAYNKYDNVAVVTDSLIKPTSKFTQNINKIVVANNVIDYKNIINKSKEEIKFDDNTESNMSIDKIKKILNSKNNKKFINVGRFSKEKGHDRLIRAFEKINDKNKNTYLIIIGGHGVLYDKTKLLVETSKCKENIVLIKSLKNPFPIVKKCNCFVLSSYYEGFGLCLVEADILGLQSFSVDIDGPKNLLLNNNGNIVENSENGICDGMKKYLNNKLNRMKVDYEKYNEQAIEEFYSLLESDKYEK